MYCVNCGAENPSEAGFCRNCGMKIEPEVFEDEMSQEISVQQPPADCDSEDRSRSTDPQYKPIGMWGYFGYELLFAIPLVGFILLLVFSFGGTQNINLRNFARSYFCWLIIFLVILLVAIVVGIALSFSPGIYF